MQNKLWFRAKRYGWGWYPATWQGWVVLLVYVLALVLHVISFIKVAFMYTTRDVYVYFLLPVLLYNSVLITVCYLTGETPRWRWGGDDASTDVTGANVTEEK